ncbi:MAG: iron ABC transporter permease [Pseudomonadota bacterium]
MKGKYTVSLWLAGGLLLLALLSMLTGRSGFMTPGDLTGALQGDSRAAELTRLILVELRLPRTVLACLVGAALGLSGAVLQGLTRNPLADPGLLGVSAGAALGAVIALYTGIGMLFALAVPMLGLLGALAAATLTLSLGSGGGTLVLILAGAAVSGLMLAGTALVLNMAPNPYAAYEITHWMLGSLADRGWDQVWLTAPFILVGAALLLGTGRALDALSLGEQQAASLGVDLSRLRRRVLVGTALAIGAATAVSGTIGFIGLVAPHLVRPLTGHQPARVLWPSAMCGALLLLLADVLTRLLPLDRELNLGVLTGLVGTPFFIALVLRLKRVAP